MRYEYEIYKPGSVEDVVAVFPSEYPIPNLQVGNCLTLLTDDYSPKLDRYWEIQRVEVYLHVSKDKPQNMKVMVFSRDKERTPLQ